MIYKETCKEHEGYDNDGSQRDSNLFVRYCRAYKQTEPTSRNVERYSDEEEYKVAFDSSGEVQSKIADQAQKSWKN